MERTGRSVRNLAIAAVIVAIISMGIGFAALQQSLEIGGPAVVRQASFQVAFANLQEPTVTGMAEIITPATLAANWTTMSYAVGMTMPGDAVEYIFDVRNTGTISARVSSINLTGVAPAAAANVNYTLTYADGTAIQPNDVLEIGQSRGLRLSISYAGELREDEITLGLGATIVYVPNQ